MNEDLLKNFLEPGQPMKSFLVFFFAFFLSFPILEASQMRSEKAESKQELIQTREHVAPPQSSIARCVTWVNSLVSSTLSSAETKKIAAETLYLEQKKNKLLAVLHEVTALPEELIGLISLYNQAVFDFSDIVCSITSLTPPFIVLGDANGEIIILNVDEAKIVKRIHAYKGPVFGLATAVDKLEFASLSTVNGYPLFGMGYEIGRIRAYAAVIAEPRVKQDEPLRLWRLNDNSCELIACSEGTKIDPDQKHMMEKYETQLVQQYPYCKLMETWIERMWSVKEEENDGRPVKNVNHEKDAPNFHMVEEALFPEGEASCFSCGISDKETGVGWSTGQVLFEHPQKHEIRVCKGSHAGPVRCMRNFVYGGKQYVISGSQDGTARIWKQDDYSCVQTIYGHKNPVVLVAFLPPRRIISVSAKSVRIDQLFC